MEKIETLEDLRNVFSNPESTKETINNITDSLINKFCIKKHDTRYDKEMLYRPVEIESYYVNNGKGDSNTIPRQCNSLDLFVHDYGIDIAYQTIIEDQKLTNFGGVLIRSVEIYSQENGEWKKKGVLCGPLLVMREIINHFNKEFPAVFLLPKEIFKCPDYRTYQINSSIIMTRRIGFVDCSEFDKRAVVKEIIDNPVCERIVKTKGLNNTYIFKYKKKKISYNPKIKPSKTL